MYHSIIISLLFIIKCIYRTTKKNGSNIVIQLFHKYVTKGRKFSKTIITGEGQCMDTNSFIVRLVFSSSTNWFQSHSRVKFINRTLPSLASSVTASHMHNLLLRYDHEDIVIFI